MKTNFKAIQATFLDVMERPADERGSFISEVCGDNTELRKQIETLLKAHEDQSGVLDRGLTHEHLCNVRIGDSIGPYKLREEIGEGGFGVVYVAEQRKPVSRKVALKVIKPGMDSRNVVARFSAERQALAMMDHPNVAKVLDVGSTETDLPYFVMELVHGVSITEFCEAKQLTTRQRLKLFIDVCLAIQHAHQKGIIHRDLKPTNIMVAENGDRPVVKVIDFGVAKALHHDLTDLSIYSGFGQLVGTPIYMSPEQAMLNSNDVDARSDIYSLGVLLYELITSTTPFGKEALQKEGMVEVCRMIREVDPPKPSARLKSRRLRNPGPNKTKSQSRISEPSRLIKQVRGELDWIVMRALEKDRTRRYQTAISLADDVRNYLDNDIVNARPPSRRYRLKKYVGRHRGLVASIAAIVAVILAGFLSTFLALIDAFEAREHAVARTNEATRERTRANLERDTAKAEANNARLAESNAVSAREESEESLARSNYHLAIARWESGRIVEAFGFLDRIPPALRSFEWHLARRQFRGSLLTIFGHTEPVQDVAVSPDGEWIVSAGDGLRVWDSRSGTDRAILAEPFDSISKVAVSHDGKLIASANENGIVRVWNAGAEQLVWMQELEACRVTALCFRPDNQQLAIGLSADGKSSETVTLWDVATGEMKATLAGHTASVNSICYSADGSRVVTGGLEIKVWDAATGRELTTLENESRSSAVDMSPDGTRVVASSVDGTLTFWNAITGDNVASIAAHDDAINSVAFSPSGAYVASASSDMTVKIWHVHDGSEHRVLKGHMNAVTSVSFYSSGAGLVTGSRDGTVKVWDLTSGDGDLALHGHIGAVRTVDFNNDGSRIVSAGLSDRTIRVWDAMTGREVLTMSGHDADITCIGYSQDGARIASGDAGSTLKIWDAETGDELHSIVAHDLGVTCLDFSPDGQKIVSGALYTLGQTPSSNIVDSDRGRLDGLIKVWNARTGEELTSPDGHTHDVYCVRFSPDGTRIVSGGFDGQIKVWEAATGNEITSIRGYELPVMSVEFNSDGSRIVSGAIGFDGEPGSQQSLIKVWDVESGTTLQTLYGHSDSVVDVGFSPDDQRIVSTSLDNTIRIWDAMSGQELRSLGGQGSIVFDASFSPDGNRIASSGGTVSIWDATPGQELRSLHGHTGRVYSAFFDSRGSRVYSSGEDGTIRVWDTHDGAEVLTLRAHANRINSLVLSTNGERVVSASEDSTIKIWDSETGEHLQTLNGHKGPVYGAELDNTDSKIFSIGEGGERLVWDAKTGDQLPSEEWRQVRTPRRRTVGRWHVSTRGKDIVLVDLEFKRRQYEESTRAARSRPNARWHHAQVEYATRYENLYAATFHLAWILKIELEQAGVVSRFHTAVASLREEGDIRTSRLADLILPMVMELLQKLPPDDPLASD